MQFNGRFDEAQMQTPVPQKENKNKQQGYKNKAKTN